ncbi:MAG: hypothetical protein ACRDH5_11985, partial [bacterium]
MGELGQPLGSDLDADYHVEIFPRSGSTIDDQLMMACIGAYGSIPDGHGNARQGLVVQPQHGTAYARDLGIVDCARGLPFLFAVHPRAQVL